MKNKKSVPKSHMSSHKEDSSNEVIKTARSTGIGIVSALATLLLLVLSLSAVALMLDDPNKVILPFSALALCISSLIGGFIAMRINSSSALLCGLLTGSALLILYLFLSFVFPTPHSTSSFLDILCFRVSIPVMSITGAYLGIKRKARKPHRR